MIKTHGGHSEESWLQRMELAGTGRTPDEFWREFERRAQAIRERNAAAASEDDGPLEWSNAVRALRAARQEIRQLRKECDSLQDELVALIPETRRIREARRIRAA